MSAANRLEGLFARTRSGIKPGLALMQELVAALDHPQRTFLILHVAGTNGKGSVCALVASLLQERGLKTGLFTSPHLMRVHERIHIQGEPVSDEVLLHALDQIERVEPSLERAPTFFETLTALAFLAFRESGVQVAVVETGLGGRLDSTNVVEPLVTAITRVELDHQEFLGETLAEIAGEKAGILKPGRPTVLGAQVPEVKELLVHRAEALGCVVWDAPERVELSGRTVGLEGQSVVLSTTEQDVGRVRIPLLGAYQMENLATAVSLVEAACSELNLEMEPKQIKQGLANTVWQGRGQVLSEDPPTLLDVAHNPGGARALRDLLQELFGKKAKGVWVWSSLEDKDAEAFLNILKPHITEVLCVELDSPRARSGEDLLSIARSVGCPARQLSLEEAKSVLPSLAEQADFGCIAGSVYLAGAWLSESPTDPGEHFREG